MLQIVNVEVLVKYPDFLSVLLFLNIIKLNLDRRERFLGNLILTIKHH